MTSKTILIRESDGKEFRVKELAHWSLIEADDGEQDWVKLYGFAGDRELLVSAGKGCTYETVPDAGKEGW